MATARASTVVSRRTPRVSTRVRRTSPRQGPRAPEQLVERMVNEASLVVAAYTDRLMRALEPLLQERFGVRLDETSLGEVFDRVQEGHVSRGFLERMFRLTDQQAANDLSRVVAISPDQTLRGAAEMQAQWVERNTELIQMEERARAEVREIIEGPLREGIRVEEVRARIQERMGVVQSRAELIARDQTLKLYGQIQEARQTDAGIEEYTWSTSLDERVRSRHTELEGTTQRWDTPPVVDRKTGRRAHPGEDFQCLPGNARIGFSGPVNGAFRRWYAGELTQLVTSTGETLECTPNHPVLTATGWQPAESIQVGDDLLRAGEHGARLPEADVQSGEPSVAEVFEALALALGASRPGAVASQFHGDPTVDNHIDVVDVDGGLRHDLVPALGEHLRQLPLPVADPPRSGLRKAELVLERLGLSAHGGVGALRLRLAQFFGRLGESHEVGSAAIARLHTVPDQQIADGTALDPVALGEALDGGTCSLELQAFLLGQWLRIVRRSVHPAGAAVVGDRELADRLLMHADASGDVSPAQPLRTELVKVIETSRVQFRGHVFNLSTDGGWYTAGRTLVHNCRCAAIPILPTGELPDDPPPTGRRRSLPPPSEPEPPTVPDPVLPDPVELERQRVAELAREQQERRVAEAQRLAEERRAAEAARLAQERERQRRSAEARQTVERYADRVQFDATVPVEMRETAARAVDKVGLRNMGVLRVAPSTGDDAAEGLYLPRARDVRVRSEGYSAVGVPLPDVPGPGKVFSMGTHPATQAAALRNTVYHELGHHAHLHANQRHSPGSGTPLQRVVADKVNEIVERRWLARDREYLTDYAQSSRTLPRYRASEYFAEAFAAYHAEPAWLRRVAPKAFAMVEDVLRLRKQSQ
jgi:SPP1 gp7 family putative phage head morphogenesis protein